MDVNEQLLEAVRNRRSSQQKATEFGHGILTADKYVQTIQDCVGMRECQRFARTATESFGDAMLKASRTLVYSNSDMELIEKGVDRTPDGIEWPKNMLMSFTHILTTPRKDRDGDILRTEGASVDPKMLLLWQHMHTIPIGKMVYVVEHNSKRLVLCSAIVDTNPTAHDAAVMIDNDMARFSHGFRALEFSQLKEAEGNTTSGGFDVKRFEIMEASVVSVPSNVDAEVMDKMVGLVESGKLTSPMMKAVGKSLRQLMPVRVAGVDLSELTAEKERHEDENGAKQNEAIEAETKETGCTCGGASKEADDDRDDGNQNVATQNTEVSAVLDGSAKAESLEEDKMTSTTDQTGDSEKAGRTISRATMDVLKECADDMDELHKEHCTTRAGKALCERCSGRIKGLLSLGVTPEDDDVEEMKSVAPLTPPQVFAAVLELPEAQRTKLFDILRAMDEASQVNKSLAQVRELIAGNHA